MATHSMAMHPMASPRRPCTHWPFIQWPFILGPVARGNSSMVCHPVASQWSVYGQLYVASLKPVNRHALLAIFGRPTAINPWPC
eukprot:2543781-Lingulodinium_polyedra.AAC.1